MKLIWKEDKKKIENTITINEMVVRLAVEKVKSSYMKYLNLALLGRNMALVYAIISIFFGITVIEELIYSIPAFLSAIAMIYSFFKHISLKKIDFNSLNTLQLQKSLCKFRIHMSKSSGYDSIIVMFWMLSVSPIYLKRFFNIYVYDNPLTYFSITIIIIGISYFMSTKLYKDWDLELSRSENELYIISNFEQEELTESILKK